MKYATTLAVIAVLFAAAIPASASDNQNVTGKPNVVLPGDGGTSGYWDTEVTASGESYGYDAYGGGAWCRWIAIRDSYVSLFFGYKTFLGVFQAYVCRRGGLVTRFDQKSAFGVDYLRFPDTLIYHMDWNVQYGPTETSSLPTYATSSQAGLRVAVCALVGSYVCGGAEYPRYEIDAAGGGVTCYVGGQVFYGCVGHRYR